MATSAAVFLALAGLSSALGYLSYRSQSREAERQYSAELSNEVGLRKAAIERWLDERWADTRVIGPTIGHLLLDAGAEDRHLIEARAYLENVRANYGYNGVSVVRGDGRELVGVGQTFADVARVRATVAAVANTGRQLMIGPYPLEQGKPPLIAFMLPLRAPHGSDQIPREVLAAYADPRHVLFGILQDQPAGSWEALLVRGNGDAVEFISPRKFDPEGRLPARLPITRPDLPAALATRGISGVHEGVDYRGARVLYAAAPISGTDWHVLEKLDRAEALAPTMGSAKVTAAWVFLLIALAGLAVFWYERRRDLAGKLFRHKAALERTALEEHFRSLTRYVNDATFLYDADGRIIEANERACEMYGYATEEFHGMPGGTLRAPDVRAGFRHGMRAVLESGSATLETTHQRKDGTTFPVEVSARRFEVEGREFFHSVIRDISERKAAEARIHALNRLYQTLWQTNEALVQANSRDEMMGKICRIAVEVGALAGAWISMVDRASGKVRPVAMSRGLENYLADADINIDADDPHGRGPIGRAIREGRPVIIEDFMHDPELEPWRKQAAGLSVVSSAAFPLRIEGEIVGTLSYHAANAGFFNEEVVQLLDQTARDVGYALTRFTDNDRRRAAERELADSEERFKQAFESASIGIALIAPDARLIKVNPSLCTITGHPESELVGSAFQIFLAPETVEPLMQLFGRMLTGERETVRAEGRIVHKQGRFVWVRANAARVCDAAGKLRHLVVQVEDISDFKEAGERVRQYMEELEETMTGTIRAVSTMIEIRDPYTAGHELRVGRLAAAIAGEVGLDAERCRGMEVAGSLHDIGKISVPAEILSKPTRLQPAEYEIVKTHAQSGYDILKDIRFPWPIAEVARQHHERLDGSGYPQGLKGDQIILEARILAVADVVESMGSHRPYRPARGIDAALEEISQGRGRLYDPQAVDACLRLFRDKGYRLPQ